MKVKRVHFKKFKRFTDLEINQIPANAKLIVLVGSNGSGKSSVFDGFRLWHGQHDGRGLGYEKDYYHKIGTQDTDTWNQKVNIAFHSNMPTDQKSKKKIFYFRSAYRNQSDFTINNLSKRGSDLDAPRVKKMIDNDAIVSDNYQRLVSKSIYGLYDDKNDDIKVKELRNKFIGEVQHSMHNLFGNINLKSIGDPMEQGSFYFDKGVSNNYPYKNLSGGEKAAFDLLLDLIVKKKSFDNTIYCIDEPELHMHTRLQGNLLEEMFRLIPENSQMWIATHSIGMMKKAKELKEKNSKEVVFLDFHDRDFDKIVSIEPSNISRDFWRKILNTALDDLSELVAPSQVVLCEGKPEKDTSSRSEFDASCYRKIFNSEYPDTDFISVGNADNVADDKLYVGQTIQTLTSGTNVIRLIDRDDRSDDEVKKLEQNGIKVLGRRNIESYLLDDEVLELLCLKENKVNRFYDVLNIKISALYDSVNNRGNASDDLKSAAGEIYVKLKQELNLTSVGNDTNAFLRDTLAPLITPNTQVYKEIQDDIFN